MSDTSTPTLSAQFMKPRSSRQSFDADLAQLSDQFEAARIEASRRARRRPTTEHKLDEIGRHLADLSTELDRLAAARDREHPQKSPRLTR